MGIILDADVVIRGEKNLLDLQNWFAKNPDEEFELAAITVAELWHAIERATPPHRRKREDYLQALLSLLPIRPYTSETAFLHARIWAELEAKGAMIGSYDLIVAATALELGSKVATFNKRHFEGISGLRVVVPP